MLREKLQSLIEQMKSEGFRFVEPRYKDQAALDKELESVKETIRRTMDEEARRKITYRVKPTKTSDYSLSEKANKPKSL